MSRSALQIFEAEAPEAFEVFKLAAQLSQSEKVPVAQRAALLFEISNTFAPYIIKAAAESLADPEQKLHDFYESGEKPKYRWVNGARVKVK